MTKKSIVLSVSLVVIAIAVGVVLYINDKSKSVENGYSTETTENLEEVSRSDKLSYKEIGEAAATELGNVSDEEKKEVKKEAIYKAIFDKEGANILKSIDITNEEAQVALYKNTFAKLKTVYLVTLPENEEAIPVNNASEVKDSIIGKSSDNDDNEELVIKNYYVYEGDTSLDNIDLKLAFPKAEKIESRDATIEDNIDEAKRTLASRELVKILTNKTTKVMDEK